MREGSSRAIGVQQEVGHRFCDQSRSLDQDGMAEPRQDGEFGALHLFVHQTCHARAGTLVVLAGHDQCRASDAVEDAAEIGFGENSVGGGVAIAVILGVTPAEVTLASSNS